MRICFLSSQMNAIGEFSAPLNGVRRGHPEKMSSRQKQKTPSSGLSGTHCRRWRVTQRRLGLWNRRSVVRAHPTVPDKSTT
jgi:hypothetical protein